MSNMPQALYTVMLILITMDFTRFQSTVWTQHVMGTLYDERDVIKLSIQNMRQHHSFGIGTLPSTVLTVPSPPSYLVTNLMGADLNNIVKFQRLSDEHVQFLIYQLLRGLKVIHSLMYNEE